MSSLRTGLIAAIPVVAVAVVVAGLVVWSPWDQSSNSDREAFCLAVDSNVAAADLGSDPDLVRVTAIFSVTPDAVAGAPREQRDEMNELREDLIDAVDSGSGTLPDADAWVDQLAEVRDTTRGLCADS